MANGRLRLLRRFAPGFGQELAEAADGVEQAVRPRTVDECAVAAPHFADPGHDERAHRRPRGDDGPERGYRPRPPQGGTGLAVRLPAGRPVPVPGMRAPGPRENIPHVAHDRNAPEADHPHAPLHPGTRMPPRPSPDAGST
ncbi:hypothetical protein HOK021_40850 [Streptomyces hygroscopicus]|nr:hypothetical protein HOK021_40850 [Streptomyces hygroscopicus]